jgi:8-oxo-dGTP pyrophosphatase MutT (NUDIX family)
VGADVLVQCGEGEVLLQLRRDGRYWSMPGGALEPGESLEDAARRELQEETGLVAPIQGEVRRIHLLGTSVNRLSCGCSGHGRMASCLRYLDV